MARVSCRVADPGGVDPDPTVESNLDTDPKVTMDLTKVFKIPGIDLLTLIVLGARRKIDGNLPVWSNNNNSNIPG